MQIAIISDTHMPRGPRRLPADCVEQLKRADLIVHAGDLVTMAVLEELESYGPVCAVCGNVDDREVRRALPQTAVIEADGSRIGVIHDGGPRNRRISRLRQRFAQADAVVFGHSHIPLHERSDEDGFQIFNPGSPTERRRSPRHTMGLAHAVGGALRFELIEVGSRTN